jgi:hypothetical protein
MLVMELFRSEGATEQPRRGRPPKTPARPWCLKERTRCPTPRLALVDFHVWLRRELEACVWRAAELARATDLKIQVVAKWLSADLSKRITPNPTSCRLIGRALDVDPDLMLEAAGHRPVESRGELPSRPVRG